MNSKAPDRPETEAPEHDPLKENDLEYFLFHLNEWWDKHGFKTLVAVLVVLLAVVGYRWMKQRAAQAQEDAWTELATSTSPESLRMAAAGVSNPVVRASAHLRAADLLVTQARSVTPEAPGMTDRDKALEEAKLMYDAVLADTSLHAVMHFNAQLGLAAVAESRSQWEEAATLYQTLAAKASDFPDLARQAQAKLADLPRLQNPVAFAPDPPAPATAPAPAPTPTPAPATPDTPAPDVAPGAEIKE